MDIFTVLICIGLALCHFVSDFICQTNEQAQGKSSSNYWLTEHVATYSIVFLTILLFISPLYFLLVNIDLLDYLYNCLLFCFITFCFHWIQDYYTSRINKYFWNKNKIHEFFIGIGADQFLHYVQLFLTTYFIFK